MAYTLDGEYTIKQVLYWTKKHFPSRFKNLRRDKVKMIRIKSIQYYEKDRTKAPKIMYEIISRSTPQYKPYFTPKDSRGRRRKSQRKIKHEYETIIQLGEMSINTTQWKMTLGSLKKWNKKPSQQKIKSIYHETMDRWKRTSKTIYKKDPKKAKKWLDKKIRDHKKRAKYHDIAEFNEIVNGINPDFYFRLAMVYKLHGHLYSRFYGLQYLPKAPNSNPKRICFFTKHQLSIIKTLLEAGIIKNN